MNRDPYTDPQPGDRFRLHDGDVIEIVDRKPFGDRRGIGYLRNGYGPFRWWLEWTLMDLDAKEFGGKAELLHVAD